MILLVLLMMMIEARRDLSVVNPEERSSRGVLEPLSVLSRETSCEALIDDALKSESTECHENAKEVVKLMTGRREYKFNNIEYEGGGVGVSELFIEMSKPIPRVFYVDFAPIHEGVIETFHSFAIVTTGVNGNFKMIQSWINEYTPEVSLDTTTSPANAMPITLDFVLNMIKTGGGEEHFAEIALKSLFFPNVEPSTSAKIMYRLYASQCHFEFKYYRIAGCRFEHPGGDEVSPSSMLSIGAHAFHSSSDSKKAIETIHEVKEVGDIEAYCNRYCTKMHWAISLLKRLCLNSCMKIGEVSVKVAAASSRVA